MSAKTFLDLQQFIIAQFIFVVTMLTAKINAFFNIRNVKIPYVTESTPYLLFWQIVMVHDVAAPIQKKKLLPKMKEIAKKTRSYQRLKKVVMRTSIFRFQEINSILVSMTETIGSFDEWEKFYTFLEKMETRKRWFQKINLSQWKENCINKMIKQAFWQQDYGLILGKISQEDVRRTHIKEKMRSAPILDLTPKAHADPIFG